MNENSLAHRHDNGVAPRGDRLWRRWSVKKIRAPRHRPRFDIMKPIIQRNPQAATNDDIEFFRDFTVVHQYRPGRNFDKSNIFGNIVINMNRFEIEYF
ncbi:MAG: hypothetical protein ACP5M1_12715 [Acidiphilium sp.]